MLLTRWFLFALLAFGACDDGGGSKSDSAGDADTDADGDADADADADTDADSDADTDTDTSAFCEQSLGSDSSCPADTLSCGDSVDATNEGGSTQFDLPMWTDAFCAGSLINDDDDVLDGPERVFLFDVPANEFGTVTLDSPCADLEMRSIAITGSSCPGSVGACTQASGDFPSQSLSQMAGTANGQTYLIIVDSYDGDVGNFTISTSCSN